jgi:hypothetical protein
VLSAWTLEDCCDALRAGTNWWSGQSRWPVTLHMVYGDISGGSPVLTAGSYLGKEEQWMNAIAAWIRALNDAGVDHFRATEFYNARGAFDNDRWRKLRDDGQMVPGGPLHDEFAARFTSIPPSAGLIGFAYSIDVPSFMDLVLPELQKERRKYKVVDERVYVVMANVARVGRFLTDAKYTDNGRIQIMFEEESGGGKYIDFFVESRKRKERWTYFFQSFDLKPKSFPPIQMGDLAAHEGWRRTKQVWNGKPDKLRKSFQAMIGTGRFELQAHSARDAVINGQRMRELWDKYPDGLIPPTAQ